MVITKDESIYAENKEHLFHSKLLFSHKININDSSNMSIIDKIYCYICISDFFYCLLVSVKDKKKIKKCKMITYLYTYNLYCTYSFNGYDSK